MKLRRTSHFERSYKKAPAEIRASFDKQSLFLLQNLQHPGLHAKKYDEAQGLWQARLAHGWRFYFLIQDDTYFIVDMKPHPK